MQQMELPLNFMTDEEKGYTCPDNCPECPYKNTLCIVFSPKGKAIFKKWQDENFNKSAVNNDLHL